MVRDINKNGNFESDEIFYYVKNHLNSVTELLDHTGEIYQRYTYKAYGETKIAKHNPSRELIPNRYAYTSREIDEHTGLYYYRARWYDPHAGRFVSEDPIGFDSNDTNLYRYVGNSPVGYKDPSGKFASPIEINNIANNNNNSAGGEGWKNAFKHCYASCMQTAENGEAFAFVAGWLLEAAQTNLNMQSDYSIYMDVHNNAIGRKLGAGLGGGVSGSGGSNIPGGGGYLACPKKKIRI